MCLMSNVPFMTQNTHSAQMGNVIKGGEIVIHPNNRF